MANRTISLCPTTSEIASKIPNFSGWVRMQLHRHHQQTVVSAVDDGRLYQCPKCLKHFVARSATDVMYCMNKDCSYSERLTNDA